MKKLFKILLISFIVVLAPIIAIAVFLYATAFSNWWLKFPEPQRSQIALAHLEKSGSGIICRDNCVGEKLVYRQMILSQLEKRGYDSGVGKLMLEHISWENRGADYRGELIGLIRQNEEKKKEKDQNYTIKIPQALLDYLNKNGGNADVKSQILVNFPEDAGASDVFISNLLSLAQDKSNGLEERRQAMTDLKNIMNDHDGTDENPIFKYKSLDYPAICDIFLTIAEKEKGESPKELSFRAHTLNAMNGCLWYKDFYKEEYFDRLKNIFYEDGVHPGIQRELFTEFYYFQNFNLDKYAQLMRDIVNDKSINKIVRSDASDSMKELNISHEVVNLSDEEYEQLRDTLDFYTN